MADQIDRLIFEVAGRDRGGSKVLADTSKHADAAHQSMSKLGSTLSGLGGPFEQVTSLAGGLGDAFEGSVGKTAKLGLGLAAAGVALTAFGAKDAQAQSQLRQSVENTGQSYSDYRGQIEEAIKAQERNAHTADDTQNALATLTTATQDTAKSLSEMSLVADIAAVKHENLAAAATQVVQAQSGSTRAFKSFGITLDGVGTKTEQIDRALKQLTDRLHGQAGAAVDTTTGRFKVWGVELEDTIARLSKFGPALTIAGAGLTGMSAVVQYLAARKMAETAVTNAQTAAEERLAAARGVDVAAIETETVATTELAAAQTESLATSGRFLSFLKGAGTLTAGLTAAVVGYELVKSAAEHPAYHVDPRGQIRSNSDNALAPGGKFGAVNIPNTQPGGRATGLKPDTAATKDATSATDAYATSLLKEKAAATQAANSIDGHLKALQASVQVGMDLASAQDGLSTSMHNLAQSVHDGSTALKGNSTAAINNRAALRDVVNQELQVLDAMRAHHVSADKVSQAARSMSRAIEQNATDMGLNRRQVHLLLGDLNVLPGEIYNALAPAASLSEQVGESIINGIIAGIEVKTPEAMQAAKVAAGNISKSAQFTFGAGGEGSGPQTAPGPDPKQKKSAKDYGANVAANVVSGYAPAVDTGVAAATQKALDKAKQKIEAERQQMHALLQQVTSADQSTKQSLIDAANIGSTSQNADMLDSFGDSMGPGNILASKRQYVQQLVHFAHLLNRLRQAGYHSAIIDQVEALGVAGIPAAEELLAGGSKERRALNRVETRIERVSGRIAGEITAGDYGSEIIKELRRLPDALERKMIQALRHERIYVDTDALGRKRGREVRNKS